jgi:hypothetical protein
VNLHGWLFLALGAFIPHLRIVSISPSETGPALKLLAEYPDIITSEALTTFVCPFNNKVPAASMAITVNNTFLVIFLKFFVSEINNRLKDSQRQIVFKDLYAVLLVSLNESP